MLEVQERTPPQKKQVFTFLDTLLDLLMNRIFGIIAVGKAPLVTGKWLTWLQHTQNLLVAANFVRGMRCCVYFISRVKFVIYF